MFAFIFLVLCPVFRPASSLICTVVLPHKLRQQHPEYGRAGGRTLFEEGPRVRGWWERAQRKSIGAVEGYPIYTDPRDLATSGVSETKPRVTMSPTDMISYDTNIITVSAKRVNDARDRWLYFLWVHAPMSWQPKGKRYTTESHGCCPFGRSLVSPQSWSHSSARPRRRVMGSLHHFVPLCPSVRLSFQSVKDDCNIEWLMGWVDAWYIGNRSAVKLGSFEGNPGLYGSLVGIIPAWGLPDSPRAGLWLGYSEMVSSLRRRQAYTQADRLPFSLDLITIKIQSVYLPRGGSLLRLKAANCIGRGAA